MLEPSTFGVASAEIGGDFQSEAVAADLDGDGRKEVIFVKKIGDGTARLVVLGTPAGAPAIAQRGSLRGWAPYPRSCP